MTLENLKKLKAHYEDLISKEKITDNPIRDNLIKSDAKDNLKSLISKHPEVVDEVVEKPKTIKPKEKA